MSLSSSWDQALRRADSLLALMTLDEKLGQMILAERYHLSHDSLIKTIGLGGVLAVDHTIDDYALFNGEDAPKNAVSWADHLDAVQSWAMRSRLKIPLLLGVDAVHGIAYLRGATIFPHNIGMGCARNSNLVKQRAEITAREMGALGFNWNFAPCVAVARDIRWGRTYESYGEDPSVVKMLGEAEVKGFQRGGTIIACAKHFVADGGTVWGTGYEGRVDQGDCRLSRDSLWSIHLPGYEGALDAGVMTVMASHSSWQGTRLHAERSLIMGKLKDSLGFRGFVVSDWNSLLALGDGGKGYSVVKVELAVNAGVDMIMAPEAAEEVFSVLKQAVRGGHIDSLRIDDAVRRILTVKFGAGLFERPFATRTSVASLGCVEHRVVARECVRQSIVVLKNEGKVLPLSKRGKKIRVVGSHANSVGLQCGGWTLTWQGKVRNFSDEIVNPSGTTILQGIRSAVSDSSLVVAGDGAIDTAADVYVVVVGELPYAEAFGDNDTLTLSSAHRELIRECHQTGKPVVCVLISGRPLVVTEDIPYCAAFVAAWLPGSEGRGVADVLFGDYRPTGKLSQSWPRTALQEPLNRGDPDYAPLFGYGYGLTY